MVVLKKIKKYFKKIFPISRTEEEAFLASVGPDTIVGIAGKTPHQALSEQFLSAQMAKSTILLEAVSAFETKKRFFLQTMAFFPLFVVSSFYWKPIFFPIIEFNEQALRILFVLGMQVLFFFLYGAASYYTSKKYFLLLFCFVCSFYWMVPLSLLKQIFPNRLFARIFISIVYYGALTVPLYLFYIIFFFMRGYAPLADKAKKDLKRILKRAIATSNEADEAGLRAVLSKYDPSFLTLLGTLSAKKNKHALEKDLKTRTPTPSPPSSMSLPLCLGLTEAYEYKFIDLAELPHLLVGGATRMGKSNFLNHLISSFLKLKNVNLTLIDPEEVEFASYEKSADCFFDMAEATSALKKIIDEMGVRKMLFRKIGAKKIAEYNEKIKDSLPRTIIVVDEFASFHAQKDFKTHISHIARVGRKYGVHLVIATQRPDKDVINMQVRANILATLAFGVRDKKNAALLQAEGAENITIPGRAIFAWGQEPTLVQTPLFTALGGEPHSEAGGPHSEAGGPHSEAGGPHFEAGGPHFEAGGGASVKTASTDHEGGFSGSEAGGGASTEAGGPQLKKTPKRAFFYKNEAVASAKKNEKGSFFIRALSLNKEAANPKKYGLVKSKRREKGVLLRGYWLKKI